jgi:hypothetical protein
MCEVIVEEEHCSDILYFFGFINFFHEENPRKPYRLVHLFYIWLTSYMATGGIQGVGGGETKVQYKYLLRRGTDPQYLGPGIN